MIFKMKKVLVVCLTLIMVLSMGLTAFAVPNGFMSSPSGKPAPELIEGKNESEDCTAELIITSYANRHLLPENLQIMMEDAYNQIVNAALLTDLTAELEAVAKKQGLEPSDLVVSDLFDIRYVNCGDHKDHGYFDIVLQADSLKRFVALLHYYNGTWEVIDNAEVKILNDEYHLCFSVDEFSPFAIVVDTSDKTPPITGDTNMINIYLIVMLVSAAALIVVLASGRKKQSV